MTKRSPRFVANRIHQIKMKTKTRKNTGQPNRPGFQRCTHSSVGVIKKVEKTQILVEKKCRLLPDSKYHQI